MRSYLRLTSTVLFAFLFILTIQAQQTVEGTITDAETGESLIGANVLVQGTSFGTITDIDGYFSMEVPDDATAIEISYTGYATQVWDLAAGNVINISLSPGEILEEVVVIGYGTVKKDDATGSIQAVGTEDFNRGSITSPQELLAGKIAGVNITTGGDPGGGSQIRIRGGSSLSATNDPLIVIDGVPVANDNIAGMRNPLNLINPNDIETFTVLKDASATAIFGSRASNGVILVTTKKGRLGKKVSINYNGNFSVSEPISTIPVLSGPEFRALVLSEFNEGHPSHDLLGTANTDWQEEIFQNGVGTDHNLSFSGGIADVVPYRLSLGYSNKEGTLKTDHFRRTTASLNITPGFFDNYLQFKLNAKGMFIKNDFADQGAVGEAINFDPTQSVFDINSPFAGYTTWADANGNPINIANRNPVAVLDQITNTSDVNRFVGNIEVDYRFHFLPDLRANLNIGYDRSDAEGDVLEPGGWNNRKINGERREYSQDKENELAEFYLNYKKDLGVLNSNLEVMAGYSWQHFFREDFNFGTTFSGKDTLTPANFDPREYYLVSLFGRMNYEINDKYLFTFTLRRDGTSRFSEDNRYGLFPAAAFAWRLSSEDFIADMNVFSYLKLRLGYGITGQQDIGGDFYPYLARYTVSQPNAQYQFGFDPDTGEPVFLTTLRPNGYDANIKWEETTTYNVGIDYGFFDDRLFGSIDYYYRETDDLINFIPVPAGTNLTNFINTNVGDLKNNGIEVSLNAIPYRSKDIVWDVGVNFSRNENEITRLTATDDPNYQGVFIGGISGGVGNTIQIHQVGSPANSFFVYEQVYNQSGKPIEGLYVDRNGDGQVTPDDRYIAQSPRPNAVFGFTSNLTINDFDISFAGRAALGNYVYNNNLSEKGDLNRLFNNTGYLSNIHASYDDVDFNVPQFFSDHFIEDATSLKVDHITVGYNIDELFGGDGNMRISATVQNPITITEYQGLDPETFNGIDNSIYPRSRIYLFGLNVNF